MSFLKETVQAALPIWDQCLEHPFIQGMEDGTLDPKLFLDYIIDDTLYLKEYARVFALAMYKSQTLAEMRWFHRVLDFVHSNEALARVRLLREHQITDQQVEAMTPRAENVEYTNYMLRVAQQEDIPEIMMAVLPCMLSYCYIGQKALPLASSTSPYIGFLREYADPVYLESCHDWGTFAEEKCQGLEPSRLEHLKEIFLRCSQHELNFWNMAFTPCDRFPN